jgi:hypothetical protein
MKERDEIRMRFEKLDEWANKQNGYQEVMDDITQGFTIIEEF